VTLFIRVAVSRLRARKRIGVDRSIPFYQFGNQIDFYSSISPFYWFLCLFLLLLCYVSLFWSLFMSQLHVNSNWNRSRSIPYLSFRRAEITIPRNGKQIHNDVEACDSLPCVTFELPSQCWYIASDSFQNCDLLEPISVPPSVEFIDTTFADSRFNLLLPFYFGRDHPHFYTVSHSIFVSGGSLLAY
jgi:hypothetical protein